MTDHGPSDIGAEATGCVTGRAEAVADGQDALPAGLTYTSDEMPGYRRRRAGKGFSYRDLDDAPLREPGTLRRIRALAIPPAWTDVWICPDPEGHVQATGRDARGRKQYRYHPQWRRVRDETKFERMITFGRLLPAIRARVTSDMGLRGLPRDKVLATVVHLLETTLIRVGNADYARQNRSYGLTTLRDRHVAADGSELRFRFKGKGGRSWRLRIRDRRVARIVRSCQDLPGQHLFQYLDAEGAPREVTSSDVNAYLREVTGHDVTAKDFRTWAGTVLAAMALAEFAAVDGQAATKRHIRAAIETVAGRLGNTPTICRRCYVHPEIIDGYLDGALGQHIGDRVRAELSGVLDTLRPEEALVLAFLERRLRQSGDASAS